MSVTKLSEAKDKNMDENKSKALEAALSQIERAFGKGSIMKLGGEGAQNLNVEAISTGSIGLDIALGIGGLPRGRVVEIYNGVASYCRGAKKRRNMCLY